jgi:hypothetical protein
MIAKFSGRENVVKSLGGECSEMIIALSSNKGSVYYTHNLVSTFLELISAFEKGDCTEKM